jgi:mannose-6-phosphate isomerase-like protein (cupin superfamily)
MADVGNRKLFENDRVIVWELLLEPGESAGLHTHLNDYFFQVLEGSTLRTVDERGNALGDFDFETDSTVWIGVEGDEVVLGEVRAPATHDAVNVGSTRYREILVELK